MPFGSSGPVTAVNSGSARNDASAAATSAATAHAGARSRSTISVGFTAVAGKCAASRASPAAESLPAGAVTGPPNPAATYPPDATASAPNSTSPQHSTATGRTIRTQTRPHQPRRPPGRTGTARTPPAR